MGKYTQKVTGKTHAKRPRDLWSTIDARAIPPLLPHLPPGFRYAEPMAGEGKLIDLLRPHVACAWASDLVPQAPGIVQGDVMGCELGDADGFISNPPWTRTLLHKIIIHLSDQGPTWLLFDSDWQNTNQAGAFMERCRKIVYVGRLLWIPGTTTPGFQACSWYLFDKPIAGSAPLFFGHARLPAEADKRARRVCADCGVLIDRFGKWGLQTRNGVPTPVHKDCRYPSHGGPVQIAPTPLFDWAEAAE